MSASTQVRPIVLAVLPFFLAFSMLGYLGRRLIPELDQVRPVDTWQGVNRAEAFILTPITLTSPLELALLVVGLTLVLVDYLRRATAEAESPLERQAAIRSVAIVGWCTFVLATIYLTAFVTDAMGQKLLAFASM